MSDEFCPVCGTPYINKQEFTTVVRYLHQSPIPPCEQRTGLPENPNEAETTQPDVLRRKGR
jgi:hypothetical protein